MISERMSRDFDDNARNGERSYPRTKTADQTFMPKMGGETGCISMGNWGHPGSGFVSPLAWPILRAR
jgi:hypothetical protein